MGCLSERYPILRRGVQRCTGRGHPRGGRKIWCPRTSRPRVVDARMSPYWPRRLLPAAGLLAVLLTGCVRDEWMYPQSALSSDRYLVDRRACTQYGYKGWDGVREAWWSPQQFSVCMQARGWELVRNE